MINFLLFLRLLLPDLQNPYCQVYGSFYEVEWPSQANIIVYQEGSEAFADVLVYEQDSRLYADKPGMWHFEESESFAKYTVYFTDKESEADFSVYFTEFESFAGCNN